MSGAESHPLHWPAGWPRAKLRKSAPFKMGLANARDHLMNELRLMGARYIVLSSNLALRLDGLPYAKQERITDPGISVYFQWHGKQMTFACDRWDRVEDNIRAVGKTIEALRGIERWGASDMMERAFSAFEALPAPDGATAASCWDILDIPPRSSSAAIERAYRARAKTAHPDAGGSREEWDQLVEAVSTAHRELAA